MVARPGDNVNADKDPAHLSRRFGRREVVPDRRQQLITNVFRRVAPRYDLMNDLMSMGTHRLWKRRFARAVKARPDDVIVDLAGGTGDVARLLAPRAAAAIVCDPSLPMMTVGRQRLGDRVAWLAGSGEAIPLADESVDGLTIAFGIRNVTHMSAALAEILRVLRPGGRFLCLEFSRPLAFVRPFYDAYSRLVIPRLGAWVAGHPDAYHYLVESIEGFPDQATFAGYIRDAGFEEVTWKNVSFGIACIHTAWKPDRGD